LAVRHRIGLVVVNDDRAHELPCLVAPVHGFQLLLRKWNLRRSAVGKAITDVGGDVIVVRDVHLACSPVNYPHLLDLIQPETIARLSRGGVEARGGLIPSEGCDRVERKRTSWMDGLRAFWTLAKCRLTDWPADGV
jgi:hypothetical protein